MKYFFYISCILPLGLVGCSVYNHSPVTTYIATAPQAASPVQSVSAPVVEPETKTLTPSPLALNKNPVVITPVKTVIIDACDKIKPPVIGQIPRLTEAQIEVIASSKPNIANAQILDELEKIYKYASNKTEQLRIAFDKQIKSCRKVKVIKE